jgi:hypothetical protein
MGLTFNTGLLSDAIKASSTLNVGIGTSSPAAKLHSKSSNEGLRLETTATNGNNYLTFYNPSGEMGYFGYGSGSNDNLYIMNEKNTDSIFFNNTSERMRLTNDGYLRLSTKGIQFNGDTADVNSLDDYEEGNFTPSVNLLGSVTYGSRIGYYTKIGNVVYYYIYIVVSSNDTTQDSAAYSISGLPFTSKSGDGGLNPLAPSLTENFYKTSSLIGIYFQVSNNNTAGTFLQNSWNNELANKTYYTSAKRSYYSGTNHYINITGFYYTN